MILYILRGLPGSGKSTLARDIAASDLDNTVVASADTFFIDEEGEYKFDPAKLPEAHAWCRGKVEGAMAAKAAHVVVDNTNIRVAHFKPYLDLAEVYQYKVKIVMPETIWAWDPLECFKRNKHGVPLAAIQRMDSTFEPY